MDIIKNKDWKPAADDEIKFEADFCDKDDIKEEIKNEIDYCDIDDLTTENKNESDYPGINDSKIEYRSDIGVEYCDADDFKVEYNNDTDYCDMLMIEIKSETEDYCDIDEFKAEIKVETGHCDYTSDRPRKKQNQKVLDEQQSSSKTVKSSKERVAKWRANLTQDDKEKVRIKHAQMMKNKRATETDEEKLLRRELDKERKMRSSEELGRS